MKNIKYTLLLLSFLSFSVFSAPPIITTKIVEVQLWDGHKDRYFFKIENPTNINPANCPQSEWVVVREKSIITELIYARKNNTTIKIALSEKGCDDPTFESLIKTDNYPIVRAVIF